MSLKDKKGINLSAGFKLVAESPLDVRTVVDKESEKDELVSSHAAYPGMIVHVKESKRTYQYNVDGTWEFFTKGKEYVHPTGDGNLHVPATGSNSNGRFLIAGNAPGKMAWMSVTPTTIGAADRSHTHTKSEITDFPTALKNPKSLTIRQDGGQSVSYNGNSTQSVNITPESINASRNTHTHLYAGSSSVGGAATSALKLTNPITISLSNMVTGSASLDGSKNVDVPVTIKPIDASLVQSGVFDLARIPRAAMERCVVVKGENDKYKLTTDKVQLGDTVKVQDSGKMYFVVDESNLTNDNGYEVYTAGSATSVPWSGVTDKPTEYNPSAHKHVKAEIIDFPTALKNPNELIINLNNNAKYTYDGSGARVINITPGSINASPEGHTHSYAGSSSVGGAANSVANPITILLDGTSKGAYNGSSAKEINITPESINASRNNHKHTIADITDIANAYVTQADRLQITTDSPPLIGGTKRIDAVKIHESMAYSIGGGPNKVLIASNTNTIETDANGNTVAVRVLNIQDAGGLTVYRSSISDTATKAIHANAATKVDNALTIQCAGVSQGSFDGSGAKTVNITPANIGAATSGHTHNYAGSSSVGGAATSANKVNSSLTISLNGSNQGAWDGSANKSINITPSSIGAAPSSHSHNYIPLLGSSSIAGDLAPSTDGDKYLGYSSQRWSGYFNEISAYSACVSGSLDVGGNITANKVYNAVWNADYAEAFDFEGEMPSVGTIVELCEGRKVRTATIGSKVIGVVSDSYCIMAGANIKDVKNGFKVAVGLLGQIEVNCTGEIHAGDFIVSSCDGVGIAASGNRDPKLGTIVGRAMESKNCLGVEKVLCLVMPL